MNLFDNFYYFCTIHIITKIANLFSNFLYILPMGKFVDFKEITLVYEINLQSHRFLFAIEMPNIFL